jgi:hypothetical protein
MLLAKLIQKSELSASEIAFLREAVKEEKLFNIISGCSRQNKHLHPA